MKVTVFMSEVFGDVFIIYSAHTVWSPRSLNAYIFSLSRSSYGVIGKGLMQTLNCC